MVYYIVSAMPKKLVNTKKNINPDRKSAIRVKLETMKLRLTSTLFCDECSPVGIALRRSFTRSKLLGMYNTQGVFATALNNSFTNHILLTNSDIRTI